MVEHVARHRLGQPTGLGLRELLEAQRSEDLTLEVEVGLLQSVLPPARVEPLDFEKAS
jgi:hypothetical protein